MKKFHLQAQVPITELAEVAKAMYKKGLRLIKPPDIIRFCLQTAHSLLNADRLTEDEALKFLQDAGYFGLRELEQMKAIIMKASLNQGSMEELEDLIESVKRGPSTPEEIKEMLKSPVKGVEK